MKKVLLVMFLVTLLALCVFGGAAVADAYEIEELGLTFELPEGWVEVTRGDATYSAVTSYEERFREGPTFADAMFHFAAVATDMPTTVIFWIECAQSMAPSIASYRWAPDEFMTRTSGNIPSSVLIRGTDSVFVARTHHSSLETAVIAMTQEQSKTIFCFGMSSQKGGTALTSAMDTVLASAAFTPHTTPIDPQTIVRDPVAWCASFEALIAEHTSYDIPAHTETAIREDGSYTIAHYHAPHTTVQLIGDTPDIIREIYIDPYPYTEVPINHAHGGNLPVAEAEFLDFTALAMAASIRQPTEKTVLSDNTTFVHNVMLDLAAIGSEHPHFQFLPWHGLKLAVFYNPFPDDLFFGTILYF
ncbi:MAG: hypothetical protein LBN04_05800 [Oscillospiraceae bacterium]|nr:hypothetical protein [Oscillospiraceae bacterium]